MNIKPGDTVRYLNSVGGGTVVRIEGDIAYVDEDGFETPVLARECVVVGSAEQQKAASRQSVEASKVPSKDSAPKPTQLPVTETAGGDRINMVLGFEATDLKALSRSSFEAYLVNDSNYYIFLSVAAKATDSSEWTPWYDGVVEPNIQEFLFELEAADLTDFDRVSVQYVAFKRGKDYSLKTPAAIELKVDTTRFAKLHCFRPNVYFDNPVIAFDLVSDDRQQQAPIPGPAKIAEKMMYKAEDIRPEKPRRPAMPKEQIFGPFEIDLHASALFDTLNGLEASDILNAQIERFEQAMREYSKRPGTRLIFIHGKGDGVLKQALLKELTHRFKGHDVQDAPFEKYGYGATQVTIRYVAPSQSKGRRR